MRPAHFAEISLPNLHHALSQSESETQCSIVRMCQEQPNITLALQRFSDEEQRLTFFAGMVAMYSLLNQQKDVLDLHAIFRKETAWA